MGLYDGRVVSNFIDQALQDATLTIYCEGAQTRSFCYCDDLNEGYLRLMIYEGRDCHEPHNVGNPGEFTMIELATLVRELVGADVPLVHEPLPKDDPKQRRPDITRATKNLGWSPRIPLREGLKRTIEEFKARLGV